jgi:hypothetical protein
METNAGRQIEAVGGTPGAEDKPCRRAGVLECDVREELLVYVPQEHTAVALNASARAVWELCQGTASVDDIAAALGERLGVPADALRPDVREAVDRLRSFGLLVPRKA